MRDILISPPVWCGSAEDRDVFLSCRADYARNLDGFPFSRKTSRQERDTILNRVLEALGGDCRILRMEESEGVVTEALVERGILTREEADWPASGSSRALALKPESCESCFINGVDHLRISIQGCGLDIAAACLRLKERETNLESRLRFAASLHYGYLTARPEDCGSALRLGATAFLPGILAAGVLDRVTRELLASGIEPRILAEEKPLVEGEAIGGEDSRSPIVHLLARAPLGVDEEAFAATFASAMRSLADGERKTRDRVLSRERLRLEDAAFRAAAVLRAARLLSFDESFRLLAALRSGLAYGLIPVGEFQVDPYALIDALLVLTSPSHVRLLAEEKKSADADETRAALVRGMVPHYFIS